MQTSCGSPCYAAPELVISEGLYVGSAVDIWSCGVILYAMLAGYLPFDDDPANPDGDNINLLYKYIVSTPLSFPDYISKEARDLLGIMLVPDPTRRASLDVVMKHPWLGAYAVPDDGSHAIKAFGKSVDDLERAAMEQHQQKRLAYQKQMKSLAAQSAAPDTRANRSLSYRPADHTSGAAAAAGRSKSSQPAQSEYIYQSDQSLVHSTPAHADRTYGSSSAAIGVGDDDPFAGPASKKESKAPEQAGATLQVQSKGHHQKASTSPGESSSFRHTIQVEYDAPSPSSKQGRRSEDKERKPPQTNGASPARPDKPQSSSNGVSEPAQKPTKERRASLSKPLPLPPSSNAPTSYHAPSHTPDTTPTKRADTTPRGASKIPIVNVASPPGTPTTKVTSKEASEESASQKSISSKKGHKKGVSSLDKIGLGKIFGGGSNTSGEASPHMDSDRRAPSNTSSAMLSPTESEKERDKDGSRKNRRNTLTVMVDPIISLTMRNRSGKGRTTLTPVTAEGPSAASFAGDSSSAKAKLQKEKEKEEEKSKNARAAQLETPFSPDMDPGSPGLQASSNKARKVMQWFRTKSKGTRDSIGPESTTEGDERTQTSGSPLIDAASPVQVYVTTPSTHVPRTPAPVKPQRAASATTGNMLSTPSLVKRFRNSVTVATGTPSSFGSKNGAMRIHQGTKPWVTTRPPAEVMKQVREVLEGMGLEIQIESEYKFKCIRAKKKKGMIGGGMGSVGPATSGASLAAVTMVGSAASNGVSWFVALCFKSSGRDA